MEKTTTQQKIDWLDQMENEIIPWVENLLKKELEHNAFLRNSKFELESKNKAFFFEIWRPENRFTIDDIDSMIDYSERMIKHFEIRLSEYREFVKLKREELCQQKETTDDTNTTTN